MTEAAIPAGSNRPRLSKERVLSAAMAIADRGGLPSLTIRSLAKELTPSPCRSTTT